MDIKDMRISHLERRLNTAESLLKLYQELLSSSRERHKTLMEMILKKQEQIDNLLKLHDERPVK